jgi:hypothetical protein
MKGGFEGRFFVLRSSSEGRSAIIEELERKSGLSRFCPAYNGEATLAAPSAPKARKKALRLLINP